MNLKILSGLGVIGTGITAIALNLPKSKPTPRDWNKVMHRLKEECGDGTKFYGERNKEPVNDKKLTMKEYDDCKKRIYDGDYKY